MKVILRHAILDSILHVVRRDGRAEITDRMACGLFAEPDRVTNFILAISGHRPEPTASEQLESFCRNNGLDHHFDLRTLRLVFEPARERVAT